MVSLHYFHWMDDQKVSIVSRGHLHMHRYIVSPSTRTLVVNYLEVRTRISKVFQIFNLATIDMLVYINLPMAYKFIKKLWIPSKSTKIMIIIYN